MILYIKVKPNSKENKLKKISETEYFACIKEPSEKNKANIALTKLLAKHLKVPTKDITIKNPSSRRKIIEIIKN